MQSILEDIKSGQLKQVYLLCGKEAYLRKQYRDKLRNAMVAEDDTMNYHYFEGKDINVGETIDLAETLPFFADRRVIILENSGCFKASGEQLAIYIKDMAESAFLIFVEEEVDKRSKLFKAVKDVGRVVEFNEQDERTLFRWMQMLIAKENKSVTEGALRLLLEKTGSDMENIKQELEKLICYTLNKDGIDEMDVEAICITRVGNRIFDMINAIADKKQKQALQLYYDLLALKEPPMRILALIARQFNLLLQTKELKQKGYDNKKIAQMTGLHSFIVEKYIKQASKFSSSILLEALSACVEADEDVKMGRMSDRMGVELIIARYSS